MRNVGLFLIHAHAWIPLTFASDRSVSTAAFPKDHLCSFPPFFWTARALLNLAKALPDLHIFESSIYDL